MKRVASAERMMSAGCLRVMLFGNYRNGLRDCFGTLCLQGVR